jgi:hypothetical protein
MRRFENWVNRLSKSGDKAAAGGLAGGGVADHAPGRASRGNRAGSLQGLLEGLTAMTIEFTEEQKLQFNELMAVRDDICVSREEWRRLLDRADRVVAAEVLAQCKADLAKAKAHFEANLVQREALLTQVKAATFWWWLLPWYRRGRVWYWRGRVWYWWMRIYHR